MKGATVHNDSVVNDSILWHFNTPYYKQISAAMIAAPIARIPANWATAWAGVVNLILRYAFMLQSSIPEVQKKSSFVKEIPV